MTGTAVAAAAALAGTTALIAWLRRRFVVINVDGPSMRPTLDAGDRVLVRRRSLRHVRTGDIVVVENVAGKGTGRRPSATPLASRGLSGHTWLIKRAVAVPGDPVPASLAARVSAPAGTPVPDGRLLILGDNPTGSVDSRHFGYISGTDVLGVVVRRLPAPGKEHRPKAPRGEGEHRSAAQTDEAATAAEPIPFPSGRPGQGMIRRVRRSVKMR